MNADEISQAVAAYFSSDANRGANVVAIYLFGSTARGTAKPGSDIDLGILHRRPPASTLAEQPFDVAADLSEQFRRPVDIVVMNGAPVDLVHRILRDGRLVVERDRSARIAFEVRARNEYFDLLPMLRLYRRGTAAP